MGMPREGAAPLLIIRTVRYTLIEQKLRMPQIQGVKGEAIVSYAESLTT
jgi:hypothetical protein